MARVMREPLPTDAVDLEAHLTRAEAGVAHLRPGAARQVVWAATPGDVSDVAVVYVHGFSASAAEIRPVPDAVAEALGANLYFARLTGHGTDGDDMGRARLPDWQADVAEAMAIGRMIGRRVIVMGCSTGCPLILSEMARDDAGVAGVVFVSPNIALANGAVQKLLRLPLARRWVPWIMGRRRSFEPESPAHAAAWTVEYDSQAVFTMMDAVRAGEAIDPAQFDAPLLMIGNPGDGVVSWQAAQAMAARWGGPVETMEVTGDSGADAHVILGDIMAPRSTKAALPGILAWVKSLVS